MNDPVESGMDYMVVDVDDEDNADEECVYECDFDVSKMIERTLCSIDFDTQTQEAIEVTNNMMDLVTQRYQYTSLVFAGLDADIKALGTSIENLKTGNFGSASHSSLAGRIPNEVSYSTKSFNNIQNIQSQLPRGLTIVNKKPGLELSGDSVCVDKIVRNSQPMDLPPIGTLVKKDLVVGNHVYALKGGSLFGAWYKSRICDVKFKPDGEKTYKVKFDYRRVISQVSGKCVAYHDQPEVILAVGQRIIAQYRDEAWSQPSCMYSGIIAEPPKKMNNHRYLVFFDDGYAQYVSHNEIRVVCESSEEVWQDIPSDSSDFIKKYLNQYPERPMVKLQRGHTVKTEWNGRWWIAKVVDVDGSLAKMYFHADKRTEWIYRGSTRLSPLYNKLANAEAIRLSGKGSRRHNLSITRGSEPYVEYTRGHDDIFFNNIAIDGMSSEEKRQVARKHTFPKQNVARKSVTGMTTINNSGKSYQQTIFPENEGEIHQKHCEAEVETKHYVVHECNTECLLGLNDDPVKYRGQNPLTIPIRFGWKRIISKHKTVLKSYVFYRGPCGRRLRNAEEVHQYLLLTKSKLAIDLFSMDSQVEIFGEFVPSKVVNFLKDVSSGKEVIPVCGVNSLNREYPDYVEYSTQRIPNKGVNLNLDPEFLICCSCEGDCSDADKCECQQLTVDASKASPGGRCRVYPGYTNRRLKEPVATGIYECNSRCKCNSSCLNRVVQHGLQLRLQVFKTEKRGWGLRCLHDIPQGGFVCIYAGQLLTDQKADDDGTQFGDEYLAELDYIEVVERMKEDYESDVVQSDVEMNDKDKNESDEDESDNNFNCDGEKLDSSDSDFESSATVGPRTQQTRGMEKLQKLVLRRDPNETDNSNHSWNVQPSPSSEVSSKEPQNTTELPEATALGELNKGNNDMILISSSSSTTSSSDFPKSTNEKVNTEHDKENYDKNKDKCRSFDEPTNTKRGSKWVSTRSYFGDEFCYIMDAKSLGNIGRYLNHNCTPNVFVQNVFVDTHDVRFPWVAFFASQYIRAGTELTWDYNYDVGSVTNKVLYCYCGSSKCRGRLL